MCVLQGFFLVEFLNIHEAVVQHFSFNMSSPLRKVDQHHRSESTEGDKSWRSNSFCYVEAVVSSSHQFIHLVDNADVIFQSAEEFDTEYYFNPLLLATHSHI